ncbi:MAG: glucosamine-6-phosphate deaminase [Acidobacteria bacterium]|nr:MAG: glucosamine-6-phosphate deaminase [Acidobacteriota bacterium]
MLIVVDERQERSSVRAANIVADLIKRKRKSVLGLATGKSPVGAYDELIRMHREEGLDLSEITTFNLDEYVGIPREHLQSFYTQIHTNFLNQVNIKPENAHIPDGTTADFERACDDYEKAIREAGGIDLQILGIGRTGHIGFNEPTSSLASRTRLKTLSDETIEDNKKVDGDIPTVAITMGIGTILEAKHLMLLAYGSAKAEAVVKAIEGPLTSSVSASALQMHRNVTVLLDEEAAANLSHRDYYRRVVEQTAKYSPVRLGLK